MPFGIDCIVLYCLCHLLSTFRIMTEVTLPKVKAHVSLVSGKKKAIIFEFLQYSYNTTEISDKTDAGIGRRFSDYSLVRKPAKQHTQGQLLHIQPTLCEFFTDQWLLIQYITIFLTSRKQLHFLAQSNLIDFSIPEFLRSWWPNMQRLIILATVALFIITSWWISK